MIETGIGRQVFVCFFPRSGTHSLLTLTTTSTFLLQLVNSLWTTYTSWSRNAVWWWVNKLNVPSARYVSSFVYERPFQKFIYLFVFLLSDYLPCIPCCVCVDEFIHAHTTTCFNVIIAFFGFNLDCDIQAMYRW